MMETLPGHFERPIPFERPNPTFQPNKRTKNTATNEPEKDRVEEICL